MGILERKVRRVNAKQSFVFCGTSGILRMTTIFPSDKMLDSILNKPKQQPSLKSITEKEKLKVLFREAL